jgi:hypothetical protein
MALSTYHIDRIVNEVPWIRRYYLGTFPSCGAALLPKRRKTYCFITNVQHHEDPGLHWNAWFYKNGLLHFFDSFGRGPLDQHFPHDYRDIVLSFPGFTYSKLKLQPETSFTCGYFCLHFLLVLSMGLSMEDFENEYSSDLKSNDMIVVKTLESLL